jgi:DMSO/TMAO reductase YedYZ molybdopterin-dependent catalytic subunit
MAERPTPNAPVAQRTVERRSLLEWLGTGVVLKLTSPLLTSCVGDLDPVGEEPVSAGGVADGPFAFPFAPGPGDHPIWNGAVVFTVDPQQLSDLLARWQLRVDGLVEAPRTYSFAELLALPRLDPVVDFHCVTGWSVWDLPWNGVHLSSILAEVGPLPSASHVTFHPFDAIYTESLPLAVALEPRTLLAYGAAGYTLPLAHGFPLRLVVPRLLAYKSAKYVARLELTDHPVDGYWEQRGYSYDAPVPAARLREGKY